MPPLDAPNSSRRPRRRGRRWAALLLGCGVATLGAVVVVGQSDWLSEVVRREAGPLVREAIGFDVVIGRFAVHPLEGKVRIEGLGLTWYTPNDAGLHGAPIAGLEAGEVDLGWRDGRPIVGRIELWKPSIHFRAGPEGLQELAPFDLDLSDDSAHMPWEAFWVHDGWVDIHGPNWTVGIHGLQGRPAGLDRNDVVIDELAIQVGSWRQVTQDVQLPGLYLIPGYVALPVVDVALPAGSVKGRFAIGGGQVDTDLRVELQLAELAALTQPSAILDGTVHLKAKATGLVQDPDVTAQISVEGLQLDRLRPDGSRVLFDLGDLEGDLNIHNHLLTADPLVAHWADGEVHLKAGVDLVHKGVSLSAQGRSLQLVDFLRSIGSSPAPWVALDMDLDLEAAGTLDPVRLAGSVDAVGRRLRVYSGPADDPRSPLVLAVDEGRAFAQIGLVDSVLDVDIHRFTASQGVDTSVNIDADLAEGSVDIGANVRHLPLSVLRPLGDADLQGDASGKLRFWGVNGVFQADSDLHVDGMGVLGFYLADAVDGRLQTRDLKTLEFENLDALLGKTHYTGGVDVALGVDPIGLDVDVVVQDGRLSDLLGVVLEVPGLDAHVTGNARFVGPWNRTEGGANLVLADIDLFGEPFEAGRIDATMTDGELFIDHLVVGRDGDREGIIGRGRVGRNYALNLDLHTGGFYLGNSSIVAATGVRLDGALWADVHVGGTAFVPEPAGRIDLRGFTVGRRRLGDATVAFETHGTKLSFDGLGFSDGIKASGGVVLADDFDWNVTADFRRFDLAPLFPEPANGGSYVAELTGHVEASGQAGVPATLNADIGHVLLGWDRHRLVAPKPWHVAVADGRFELKNIELDGGTTQIRLDASSTADRDVHVAGGGTIDLDLLRAVVPGMTRSSGTAEVTFAADGRGDTFRPLVNVHLEDGLFLGTWFPQAFEAISGDIVASPDRFSLTDIEGRLGGGTFTLGGHIDAEQFKPETFALTSDISGARVRYLDVLPAAVGNGHLTFDGPVDDLLLKGNIDIEDMLFADRVDWESWVLAFSGEHLSGAVEESTEDYFNMDLSIQADDTIRFRNNVGDMVLSADLNFVGTTGRPGMQGRIQAVPGGRVLLKERDFEISRAELVFSDPFTFDPDVDINVQTKVSTREQDYDINYSVGGLYSDWRTVTRSDPPLPQADINALLLFGLTMEEMERYGGAVGALAVEGGDLLASKLGIVERVGQGVVGLDTFRPERIDLVSGVSERGAGTVSSELRLLVEKDLDWATLIFEQNLSRSVDTYLGLERRLARIFYLRTYWARDQKGRRLDIGGAYGLEANVRGEFD